jgi:hypothetical protein
LVEDNTVFDCAWHLIERNFESAGMKFHLARDSLIRRNVVRDIRDGSGIWLDAYIENTRLCQNLLYDVRSKLGAIFVEVSRDRANLVDHNIVLDVDGHGIYEHDCDRLIVVHNLVAGCTGAAVMLRRGQADRMGGRLPRGSTGRKHRVLNNLLLDCGRMIEFHNPDQRSEQNAFGANREPGPFRLHSTEEYLDLATWREFYGFDMESTQVPMEVALDRGSMELAINGSGVMPKCERIPGAESDLDGKRRAGMTVPGPWAVVPSPGDRVRVDPRRPAKAGGSTS